MITKGTAIEAAGLLACELGPKLLATGIAPKLVDRARQRLREMSVVADAGIAASVGGVHAMHDATEEESLCPRPVGTCRSFARRLED